MFTIIESPSNLGLRPTGVEELPAALRRAGFHAALGTRSIVVQPSAPFDPQRSSETGILNGPALRDSSRALAQAIEEVIASGETPIVLAGDCSVILAALLATKQGLLFIDGHVDFYQPSASPTGEVADMDLAIATGRGPAILTELAGDAPLVREEDVAAVGARDAKERDRAGSQDVRATRVHLFELPAIRERGIDAIADEALAAIAKPFWCHIDADVLDDAVMPAVEYRLQGGLQPSELTSLLRKAAATKRMLGLSIAIYNPRLDPSGDAAQVLVDAVVSALR